MMRHLAVLLSTVIALVILGAVWVALTSRGADRARPDDRLLVWLGEAGARSQPAAFLMLAGTGVVPIDAKLGGRLWVVAAAGPDSAERIRQVGAGAVVAQPMASAISLGGCAGVLPFQFGTTAPAYRLNVDRP